MHCVVWLIAMNGEAVAASVVGVLQCGAVRCSVLYGSLRRREAAVASVVIVSSPSELAPSLDTLKEATHAEVAEEDTRYEDTTRNPQHVRARSSFHRRDSSRLCVRERERKRKRK